MARRGLAVVGGALAGLGEGMVRRAEKEREDELMLREEGLRYAAELREQGFRSKESQLDREARAAESRADREARAGEVAGEIITPEGDVYIYDRRGRTRRSGLKAAAKTGSGSGDPFPEQEWRAAVQANTRTNEDGVAEVDWDGVATYFDETGRPDVARIARKRPAGAEPTADSPELREFGARTDDVREALGGKRSPEVEEYLSIADRATGRGQGAPASRAPASRSAGASGAGTQDNPAKPTTQAQYDALPSGAYYLDPGDGQLYRKR